MTYKYVKAQWPGSGDDTTQIKRLIDETFLDEDGNTIVKKIESFIPFDEDNIDYQEYKTWLNAGNTPEAAD